MHYIFMGKPCNTFHNKEGAEQNQYIINDGHFN
jgi:hypothetical protein